MTTNTARRFLLDYSQIDEMVDEIVEQFQDMIKKLLFYFRKDDEYGPGANLKS